MLPYTDLHEAELALGRSLTNTETLWFNYTSNMSNFLLCSHIIIVVFFFMVIAPIPVIILELARFERLEKFKIQPKVKLSAQEMFKGFKDTCLQFVYVICPLQLASYPFLQTIGVRMGLPLPSGWEILMQLVVYILLEDYTQYWLHRFLHGKWGYENIHHLHHEYNAPTTTVTTYVHWGEVVILGFPTFLGPAVVPCHVITFWLWTVTRQIQSMETHSGYDLPWNPTRYIPLYGGAVHHDYHHFVGGQSQNNFGSIFTYCDYIYGTYKGFQYHKKAREAQRSE